MEIGDYGQAAVLWQQTEGIGLDESDTEEAVRSYLERNPGISAVAVDEDGQIIGTVLCGHEGRRGYLHHLAVARGHRRQGMARRLLDFCFARLAEAGIPRCTIFLYEENVEGEAFWRHNGWTLRHWKILQKDVGAAADP
jgi:putative acetyltransferase